MPNAIRIYSAIALSVITVLLAAPVGAQTPAIGFTTGNDATSGTNQTAGFAFTVTSTVTLTSLGLFDTNLDGLINSHMVGIFTSAGALLASATVPSGTGATLINQFRYVPVAALTLVPGTYNIGALYTTADADHAINLAQNLTLGPGLLFNGSRAIAGTTLTNPTISVDADPAVFGPNFLLGPAPVPDAGKTLLLLSLSLLPLLGMSTFRQAQRA